MLNHLAFHIRRTKQWECTLVYGMQMTGLQEVDLSRQTGLKLHSLLPTGTSKLMLVFCQTEHLLVLQIAIGSLNNLIQQVKTGSNGCRTTTWFTITAPTLTGFPKASLQNATTPRQFNQQIYVYINSFIKFTILFSFHVKKCSTILSSFVINKRNAFLFYIH